MNPVHNIIAPYVVKHGMNRVFGREFIRVSYTRGYSYDSTLTLADSVVVGKLQPGELTVYLDETCIINDYSLLRARNILDNSKDYQGGSNIFLSIGVEGYVAWSELYPVLIRRAHSFCMGEGFVFKGNLYIEEWSGDIKPLSMSEYIALCG